MLGGRSRRFPGVDDEQEFGRFVGLVGHLSSLTSFRENKEHSVKPYPLENNIKNCSVFDINTLLVSWVKATGLTYIFIYCINKW